jgi:hypothetical protein
MNYIVFVFEFGTWLVITLNFVRVRLCELEKFGCVLVTKWGGGSQRERLPIELSWSGFP